MHLIPRFLIFTFLLHGCSTVNWDVSNAADPSQFIRETRVNPQSILNPTSYTRFGDGTIWRSAGTGFLISHNGCFLTTHHQYAGVLRDKGQLEVFMPKNSSVALLGTLPKYDLALYKMVGVEEVPFLHLTSNHYELKPQEHVLIMPGKRVPGVFSANSPAEGYEMVRNRSWTLIDFFWVYRLIGEVQSGDSGSPLINHKGETIGVIISSGWGYVSAIPISRKFLHENFAEFHQCE